MITKKYYKLVKVSYEDEGYFYMRNISGQVGNFSATRGISGTGSWSDVEYSLDGVNWSSYDLTTTPTIQVEPNSNLYLRGNGGMGFANMSRSWTIGLDTDFIVGGNIYSLEDKSGFKTRTTYHTNGEFYHLFYNQTHLKSAEKLNFGNVTSIGERGLQMMFEGCSGLTTPPTVLPFTTLNANCYLNTFKDCTALITAPELPATTLTNNCYNQMFTSCSALTSVKIGATTWVAQGNWLNGVAASGTIYAPTGSDIANYSGSSGVPSGWTVVYY